MSAFGPFLLFSGNSYEALRGFFGRRINLFDNPPVDGPVAEVSPTVARPAEVSTDDMLPASNLAGRLLSIILPRRPMVRPSVGTPAENSVGSIS